MDFPKDIDLPTDIDFPSDIGFPRDDAGHPLAERFRDLIQNPSFPCVGAKAALARGQIRFVIGRDIGAADDDARLHAALMAFVCRYQARPALFQSLVVIFDRPGGLSEEGFEARMWDRLQALSDQDSRLGHAYDARVAPDPQDAHFSLSCAGEAFFVVGLHPGASRKARLFAAPALVFNLHDQFERLRAEGRYERMRETIQARDVSWAGSVNPMLTRHGERSEAPQYSGRQVPDDWACPFQRRAVELRREAGPIAADLRGGAFRAPHTTERAPSAAQRTP